MPAIGRRASREFADGDACAFGSTVAHRLRCPFVEAGAMSSAGCGDGIAKGGNAQNMRALLADASHGELAGISPGDNAEGGCRRRLR
jgi:hypothetical protein